MQLKDLVAVGSLHHAYLVRGGEEAVRQLLLARGITVAGNPDVVQYTYTDLEVDGARSIGAFASIQPLGAHKFCTITFARATDAAQNALLKTLEEAPGSTVFFLCTPRPGALLPTLRSRCILVEAVDEMPTSESSEIREFLDAPYPERLKQVERMIAAAQKQDDRTELRQFVRDLTRFGSDHQFSAAALRTLLDADQMLQQSGASPKLILSHLAVVLPPA